MRSWIMAVTVAASLSLSMVACTSARQTKPFAYPGDVGKTVEPIAAVVRKKGFEPVAHEGEWCKFKYKEGVWIHFKAKKREVVLVVDVADAKKLPKDQVDALFAEGMKVGEEIWNEASAQATAMAAQAEKDKREAEAREAEEERRKEEEAKKAAANGDKGAGTTALGVLTAIGEVAGSVQVGGKPGSPGGAAPSQGSSGGHCCVNRAYYDCPTANAVRKGCGELAACLTGCMSQSGMGCADQCIKDHPPDVSECQRDSGRDNQCK